MKVVLGIYVLVLQTTCCYGLYPTTEKQVREFINTTETNYIDTFISTTMDCRQVPGLSLAVVKGNKTWTKGYGFADMEALKEVTEDTIFAIGSITKSFTMVLLGVLLAERNITWDTKIHDILGKDYRFVDDYRTKETTLKDLLSHRTGLAPLDIGRVAGFPDSTSRTGLTKKMQYLPEIGPFRDALIYNNYMFMYLGHIAEVLGSDTWENLLQTRLLRPLGMTSTKVLKFSSDVTQNNVAKPYLYTGGRFQIGSTDLYSINPTEPAGAIMSSSADMVKWMRFLLNNGQLDNCTQLISTELLQTAMSAIMAIADDGFLRDQYLTKPDWPIGMTSMGYGLALFISSYRGYKRVWHSGGHISYISEMVLYPDMQSGIFISTNGPGLRDTSSVATQTIAHYVSDLILGLKPWLNGSTSCNYPKPWRAIPALKPERKATPTLENIEDQAAYIGLYRHSFLPSINITSRADNSDLNFTMNRISGTLRSTRKKDVFNMEILDPFEIKLYYTRRSNESIQFTAMFQREQQKILKLTIMYEVDVTYTKEEN